MSIFGKYGVGGEFKPPPLNGQGEAPTSPATIDGTELNQPDVPVPTGTGGARHE